MGWQHFNGLISKDLKFTLFKQDEIATECVLNVRNISITFSGSTGPEIRPSWVIS